MSVPNTSDRPDTVYKILLQSDWKSWITQPRTSLPNSKFTAHLFTGAGIDINDGFVHLSTAEQSSGTYTKWFSKNNPAESDGDAQGQVLADGGQLLVLVEISLTKVVGRVEWELAPSRGDFFAHVYDGGIPYIPDGEEGSEFSAVLQVWEGTEVKKALFDRLAAESR